MEYVVAKTDVINPDINSPEWDKAQTGLVDKETWTEGLSKSPQTTFKLLRGPLGISVLMHTNETHLRSKHNKQNEAICQDSCMEFFFKPTPWDARYLNFEVNPGGFMHLGIGHGRFDRILIEEDRSTFSIMSIAKEGDWTLKFYIPDNFIRKYYPDVEKNPNGNFCSVAKGNFYKCGVYTDHPHYASWSAVETKKADFHLPDFFGKIVFQ